MNTSPVTHDQSTRDLVCLLAAAKAAVMIYANRQSHLEKDFTGRSNVPEYVAECRQRQIDNATAVVVAMAALFESPEDAAHLRAEAPSWTEALFAAAAK